MNEKVYETSKITGRTYELFSQIRILNIQQCIFYLENGVVLNDIEISEDRKTHQPIMVFLFNREETRDAYDKWCKRRDQIFDYESSRN